MSKHKNDNPNLSVAVRVMIAAFCGILLMSGFFLLSASLILKNDLSEPIPQVLSCLSCLFPALISGWIAGKLLRKNGLAFGSVSTLPICLVLLCLCAAFYGSVSVKYAIVFVLSLLLGGLGGILAVNTKRKRRYK